MFPSTIGSKRCKVISTMPFNMYQQRRLKRRQVDLNDIYIYIDRERERERIITKITFFLQFIQGSNHFCAYYQR